MSFVKNRIALLNLENYMNQEECTLLMSEATSYWENSIRPNFRSSKWSGKIAGTKLNLSKKAMQELTREIRTIMILRKVADHFIKKNTDILIIQSLKFFYISQMDHETKNVTENSLNLLRFVNCQLDRCYMYVENCAHIGILLFHLLSALLNRQKKEDISRIKYIWDGISPRELSTDPEKVFFPWIIDNKNITKEQVIFLLPKPDFQMKHFSDAMAKKEGYIVSHHSQIMYDAPNRAVAASLFETMGLFFKYFLTFNLQLETLLTARYLIKIMKWLPLISQLDLKAYITSGSAVFSDDPIVTYLNEKGVKTIAWYYGTNSYLFVTKSRDCDFRMAGFCTMSIQTHIVWNRHYKKYIESHSRNRHEIIACGPIMAGDEEAIKSGKKALLEKIGFSKEMISDKSQRYVSVFDVPCVSESFNKTEIVLLDPNTEEYNSAFMHDILKLLDDFENICLIYKPKRSLTSGKFSYSPQMKKMLEVMSSNPRVAVADYNINPWIPILASDLCISMPFESPNIAALHYEKPVIFHDPLNIARYHLYISYPEIVTHSYNDLKSRVSGCFQGNERLRMLDDWSDANELIGSSRGTNSTYRFRQYLVSLNDKRIFEKPE